jgi:hypothetical protein
MPAADKDTGTIACIVRLGNLMFFLALGLFQKFFRQNPIQECGSNA